MLDLHTVLKEDIEYIAEADFIPWEEMSGKTLLVTGATGLIGSQIVYAALCRNEKCHGNITVYAAVRNKEKAEKMFSGCGGRLHILTADMTESLDGRLPAGRIDFIVHAASATDSKYFVEKPVEMILSGLNGTEQLLRLAAKRGCTKFVYLSSLEAYGITDPKLSSVREGDGGYINQLSPRSSYSEGKRIAECLCISYASEYGVPAVAARLAQTFGAGVPYQDNRIFAQLARAVIEKKDFVLRTKGETQRNYCYTRDAVAAVFLLLLRGRVGEAYNVANFGTYISVCDMAELVCREFSGGSSRVVFDIAEDAGRLGYGPTIKIRLNTEKIEKLGFRPSVGLLESYRRMIRYMTDTR